MGSLMKLPAILLNLFFSVFLLLGQVEGAENPKPQVQISSRFIDGDNVLSAPRVLTIVGQEAVIQVAQEVGDHLDGVVLAVTPSVSDGKVFLEGFAFAGKGKLGGDDGIKSRAKRALENLKGKGEILTRSRCVACFRSEGNRGFPSPLAEVAPFGYNPGSLSAVLNFSELRETKTLMPYLKRVLAKSTYT